MKKILSIIILCILSFLILYLLGAFYSTSFNIVKWEEGCRFGVVILTGFAVLIIIMQNKL